MKRAAQFTPLIALALAALALNPSAALAQVDRATVVGTVRDSSSAVVPGATVTARHAGTNISNQAITDAQGAYIIASLLPGQYAIDVELSGFQKTTSNVDLQVGQRARLDFTLAVASVEQAVTVEATSPLLSTEQAILGTVVSRTAPDALTARLSASPALGSGKSIIT